MRWRRFLVGLSLIAVLGVVGYTAKTRFGSAWRPPRVFAKEIDQIESDWFDLVMKRSDARKAAKSPAELEQVQTDFSAKERHFVERCFELARRGPGSQDGLRALYLIACRVPKTDDGQRAAETLIKQAAEVDVDVLAEALYGAQGPHPPQRLARTILERVRKTPDHPQAPRLLASIVGGIAISDYEGTTAPPAFAEAAELIIGRYADSPDIVNFCEHLGFYGGSPPWAGPFENHLRTILSKNSHRQVQAAASFALASVVQDAGESRQLEARKLYTQFIEMFDGRKRYVYAGIEKELNKLAKSQLAEIDLRGPGRRVPEIEGFDLDGRPMKLSEFRNKVVLLSFWATWCGPCMKMVPHERELATALRDEPFVIVGVNGDENLSDAKNAAVQSQMSWRSFRNKRGWSGRKISSEWSADFPSFYLIDREGVIRKRWLGNQPPEALRREITLLVRSPTETNATR